jgi:hypothetical protein
LKLHEQKSTAGQGDGLALMARFCLFFKRAVFLSSKKACNFLHGSGP